MYSVHTNQRHQSTQEETHHVHHQATLAVLRDALSRLARGEVSATTVVMAAALIALALFVGATITSRVRDKANSLDLD
jgi:hypothetical protein